VGGVREQSPKRRHIALIVGMYVHQDHRRAGIAPLLLDAAQKGLAELGGLEQLQLSVTAGNEPALALYEQAGFEVYGREPAALKVAGSNYDEFLMSRKLR
jgi:ribosomal protein S18 acetylase RimI-like enzyme